MYILSMKYFVIVILAALLAGCGSKKEGKEPKKEAPAFEPQGEVNRPTENKIESGSKMRGFKSKVDTTLDGAKAQKDKKYDEIFKD